MSNIHSNITKILSSKLGSDKVVDRSSDLLASVEVHPESIFDAISYLKHDNEIKLGYLDSITGVDLSTYSGSDAKRNDVPWSSIYGAEPAKSLMIVYQFVSVELNEDFNIKAVVSIENPQIASIDKLFGNANWLEREVFDLYGIDFVNSRDLRRIMLPEDWEGYPLRKDYKEKDQYQGMSTSRFDPLEAMKQRGLSLKDSLAEK